MIRLSCVSLLLWCALSAATGTATAQSITLTLQNTGQTIANGGTLTLPAQTNNTRFVINPVCIASCVTVSYTVAVMFGDPHNPLIGYDTIEASSGSGSGTTPVEIEELGYIGGTGTVSWQINGGSAQIFNFTVQGTNPTYSVVDSERSSLGAPWYFGQLLRVENSYNQYRSGQPWVNANPDGIGISQVDGTKQSVTAGSYWSFVSNMIQGIGILQTNAASTASNAPNPFYQRQVTEATSAHPPPSQSLPYCVFSGSPTGTQHSWVDAEVINSYVGTGTNPTYTVGGYYISWTGTNATNGVWRIVSNTADSPRSYVGDVCRVAAL